MKIGLIGELDLNNYGVVVSVLKFVLIKPCTHSQINNGLSKCLLHRY